MKDDDLPNALPASAEENGAPGPALPEDTASSGSPQKEEPFYGWRYLRRELPDGTMTYEEVPLRRADLLYPEEGDRLVREPWHTRDFKYCLGTLEALFAEDPSVVVLGDCRVDWDVEGIRPLGPDIVVFFAVRAWLQRATFRPAEEGGRAVALIEIASPGTRHNDVGIKRDLYYRVGVERYVIIDRGPLGEDPYQLIGYQRGRKGWRPMRPDKQGRLSLGPVGLVLGIESNRPWFYDVRTGERLPDLIEIMQARAKAEEQVRDEARARANAEAAVQKEARARARAEAKARKEAKARAALEERVRQLEARLRQPPEQ